MAQRKSEIKYDITQSPLYKLISKKKLASLLNLPSPSHLKKLLNIDAPLRYRKFSIESKGKLRPVEVPCPQLWAVHNRLFSLLQRMQLPEYLHSGVKGRSYLTNAKAHRGAHEVFTLDIKKFYPSVSRSMIASFFRNEMKCSKDVAAILADISTCDGHIPTGSALSQILAYLSCKKMFDTLFENSAEANIKMTCYVDDLTFSGELIFPKWIFNNIKSVIKRSGLAYHKEKHFRRHQIKEITGVIIDGDNIKVCNRHQKSIHDLLMQVATTEDIPLMNKLCNRLIGKLSAAGQIEDRFKIQRFQALQTRHRLNKHNSSPRARTSPSRHTQ